MKMIYRSKNNRGRNRAFVGAGIVVALLIVLATSGILSRGFYRLMVVLSGSTQGAGLAANSFSSLFSSKASLEKENRELKRELSEMEAALADRDILAKENADLKAAIHFKADTGNISARVMSKPPFTPFDILVVDAGEAQGVSMGDRVMLGQTFLGTVTLVSSNSSQVTLLSSSSQKQDAFIGDEALPVILQGKGGGNYETTLPQGSKVSEGDLVFTYYLQTPLYIGKVSKVISDEDNTLMSILITLPINLYSLTNVEIIS
jgi:cell shape-determining protein MreC